MERQEMEPRNLGGNGLAVAPIGRTYGRVPFYGARSDAQSTATIHRALDLGVTMFDTADMYGPWTNERLLGRALAGLRDRAVIASKCGQEIDDNGVWTRRMNGTPAYIRKAVDGSLMRMGVDHIDLYYLHRVDPDVPVEEKAPRARRAGGRRKGASSGYLGGGLRHHPAGARHGAARRRADRVLVVHTGRRGQRVLATCAELGIVFVAYAPLGRGFLSGAIRSLDDFAPDDIRRNSPRFQGDNFQKNLELLDEVIRLAAEKGMTPGRLALAWVLAQGTFIAAIPGTRRMENLEENVSAASLRLTNSDLKALDLIAPRGVAAGERYAPEFLRTVHL